MSSFKDGYAPRRGRGGWTRPFFKQKRDHVNPDTKKHPLGKLLKTIEGPDFKPLLTAMSADALISDVRYVTSYNWLNDGNATILVPGKPPLWTPVKDSKRLKEDSGIYYRDPNAARFPEYPIAPLVQAILEINTSFPATDVDVVGCGSSLGNLLRFARGEDKPFRFTLETIGNSVFFIRKENDPTEIIEGIRGFGHSFPEENTTWEPEVKGSETHQRVIQYNLGGLNCLVRFECDGYLKDKAIIGTPSSNVLGKSRSNKNDLLDAFQILSVAQLPLLKQASADCVNIVRGGSEIAQASIFDLKTRSGKYKAEIDMREIYPHLWIKQVPNFVVAYHDGAGLFRDIQVLDISKDVENWENENLDGKRRFVALVGEIVAFARDENGLLEVYSPGAGRLEIHKQYGDGKTALPASLRDKWVNQGKEDKDSDNFDDGESALGSVHNFHNAWEGDSDEDEPDYTACSALYCGYCGKCTY